MEELNQEQIKSQAQARAREQIETGDFRRLDRNDLLKISERFMIFLHHAKKVGYNEQLALAEFERDKKESLEKYAKQGLLKLLEDQKIYAENSKQAWELFKKTIAPYFGDDLLKWNYRFVDDELTKAKTDQIETYVKERIIKGITTDFASMKEADFKRKLIKQFESREFLISLDRQSHMSEQDALELREKAKGKFNRGILFFSRQIMLKPRLRR